MVPVVKPGLVSCHSVVPGLLFSSCINGEAARTWTWLTRWLMHQAERHTTSTRTSGGSLMCSDSLSLWSGAGVRLCPTKRDYFELSKGEYFHCCRGLIRRS